MVENFFKGDTAKIDIWALRFFKLEGRLSGLVIESDDYFFSICYKKSNGKYYTGKYYTSSKFPQPIKINSGPTKMAIYKFYNARMILTEKKLKIF